MTELCRLRPRRQNTISWPTDGYDRATPGQRPASLPGRGQVDGQGGARHWGDSGIGRAVAVTFGMEGANVAILYNANDLDASDTQALFDAKKARPHARCLIIKADVRE